MASLYVANLIYRKLIHNLVLLFRFFNLEFMFHSKAILTAFLTQKNLFCKKTCYIVTAVFIPPRVSDKLQTIHQIRNKLWRQEHFYTNTAVSTLGGDTTLIMSVLLQQHILSQIVLCNTRTSVKVYGNSSFSLQLCLRRLMDRIIFKPSKDFSPWLCTICYGSEPGEISSATTCIFSQPPFFLYPCQFWSLEESAA